MDENMTQQGAQDSKRLMEIDYGRILFFILSKWWIIVLAAFIGLGAGYLYGQTQNNPYYQSTVSLYTIAKMYDDSQTTGNLALGSQLLKDYTELITSRSVLENVIKENELPMQYDVLKNKITITNTDGTRMVYVTVMDDDPERAQMLAQKVGEESIKQIKKVTDVDMVNIVDNANLPTYPAGPNLSKYPIIGGAMGLGLTLIILFIFGLMDNTIKSSEEIKKYTGWTTLAMIPKMSDTKSKKK